MSGSPSPSYFVRGGARIGFVNYSRPLVSLQAGSTRLDIATTFFGLFETGRYSFRPDQIVRFEELSGLPLFGGGIRIHHTVSDCPEKIVFWCRPDAVLQGIASTGFCAAATTTAAPSGNPPALSPLPSRGFPLRILPLAVIGVLWNVLLGYEFFSRPNFAAFPGPCSLAAVAIVFVTSVAVLRSSRVQAIFLRPGRSIGEVRPVFVLVALITGIMTVACGAVFLAGLHFAK